MAAGPVNGDRSISGVRAAIRSWPIVLRRGSGRRRTSEEVRYEVDLGESLVESGAIVDEIEHVVAPEWRLTSTIVDRDGALY